MARIKALKDATATEDRKRFLALVDIFKKYGQQYNFDPLMLAAQATRSRRSTRRQKATSAPSV